MNCDYVFDILTRGPFPAGRADDTAVERHLAACHGCRELAEALRPAVAILHEAVSGEEGDSLPGYRGALSERPANRDLWASVAEAARTNDEHPIEPPTTRGGAKSVRDGDLASGWKPFASYVAAALAGVLLAVAIGIAGGPWNREPPSLPASGGASAAVVGARYQLDAEGLRMLVALNLPEVCFPRNATAEDGAQHRASSGETSADGMGAALEGQGILCCTECHYAGNADRPPPEAVAIVQQHCHACHQP